jgi:hypothetical protein
MDFYFSSTNSMDLVDRRQSKFFSDSAIGKERFHDPAQSEAA